MARHRWAVTASAALAAILVAGVVAWMFNAPSVRIATVATAARKTTPERPPPSLPAIAAITLPPPPAAAVAPLAAPAHRPISIPTPGPGPISGPISGPGPRKAVTPLPPQPRAAPAIVAVAVRPLRAEAPTPPAVLANPTETAADGRILLRLLEHGSGPGIEIRWPAQAAERERLYRVLKRCYGMRLALLDSRSRLFVEDGNPGRAWRPNLDRFSGFVRRPLGPLAGGERRQAAAIRARHGVLGTAQPVRLFPRPVDAVLLGGLRNLIGDGYGDRQTIRAQYRLTGNTVIIDSVTLNGRSVAGRIDLSRVAQCTRRL